MVYDESDERNKRPVALKRNTTESNQKNEKILSHRQTVARPDSLRQHITVPKVSSLQEKVHDKLIESKDIKTQENKVENVPEIQVNSAREDIEDQKEENEPV